MLVNLRWLTLKKMAELTGYTEKAFHEKIYQGKWPEGKVWRKSPDGRIQINLEGFNQWVEGRLKTV